MADLPTPAADLDPQAIAEQMRDLMFEHDAAAHAMGMRIEAVGPGTARVSMTVRRDMLNGFATCQGGFITALADTAFAYACNSGNTGGDRTVASGLSVDFVAPGREGDVLTATAQRVSSAGRTGVYDADVRNRKGELVAVFRGRSYLIRARAAAG